MSSWNISAWESGLIWIHFTLPSPGRCWRAGVFCSPAGLVNIKCPWAQYFKLLFKERATMWQHFFVSSVLTWAIRALEGVLVLGCKLESNVAEHTPQGLCVFTSSPFPCTARPQANPKPWKCAILRVLWLVGRAILRKEAGGGYPTSRSCGDPVSFHSSSLPAVLTSFGYTRICLPVRGLSWIGRLWYHTAHDGQ